MLELAAADGVTKVVATPHLYWQHDGAGQELQAQTCFGRFVQELKETRGSDQNALPKLELGGENSLTPGFLEAVAQGRCRSLGGSKWVLVETTPMLPLSALLQAADWLKQQDLRILWAHPERCFALHRDLTVAQLAVENGIRLQVTAGSLLGEWGQSAQRAAQGLLALGCVHVLASDGHDMKARKPILSEGVAKAANLMEDKQRGYLVHELNNTVEFRGASTVCKSDIAGAITDYLVKLSTK